MPSVVMMKHHEPSGFYLAPKQLEFFELLVKRPVISREGIWEVLWGALPEWDQPKDTKIIDQMLVQMRKKLRTEGIDVLNSSEGLTIHADQKERARKLLEIAVAQPRKKTGVAARYSPENFAASGGHIEPQPPNKKNSRRPNMALLDQEFEIEHDVPIPQTHGHYVVLFEKFRAMKPGDSFVAKGAYNEIHKTIYNASQHFRYKEPGGREYYWKLAPVLGGVRIWRLKEPTYRHRRASPAKNTDSGKFVKKEHR